MAAATESAAASAAAGGGAEEKVLVKVSAPDRAAFEREVAALKDRMSKNKLRKDALIARVELERARFNEVQVRAAARPRPGPEGRGAKPCVLARARAPGGPRAGGWGGAARRASARGRPHEGMVRRVAAREGEPGPRGTGFRGRPGLERACVREIAARWAAPGGGGRARGPSHGSEILAP